MSSINDRSTDHNTARLDLPTSKLIDWYAEGEAKTVEMDGVRIVIRFVGRRGRRGRIAIEAPAGAEFGTAES